MNKFFLGILIAATSISCATSKESTVLGVGIGSLIGGSLGATIGAQRGVATEGAFLGAAAFGAIGGAIGYSEQKKKIAKSGSLGKNSLPQSPAMTMPQVRRVWVPDQIEDGKDIQGHFIYVIDKRSTCRRND